MTPAQPHDLDARDADRMPESDPEQAEAVRVDEDGVVHVTDPRGLRAMAHPARQRALQALYDDPEGAGATATELADVCQASSASMSYHLRTLERWGLVVRGSSDDGRERPWRAAGKSLSVSPLTVASADTSDALAYLEAVMAPLNAHAARYARSTRPDDTRPVHVSRGQAALTPGELRELTDYIHTYLDTHHDPHAPAPDGEQRVAVDAYLAFLPHN